MDYKQEKALDIARQVVVAKMAASSARTDKDTGKATGEFIKAVYDSVLEIISSAE